ncbi:MAG: diguanylate cyclase [Chloroflexi bacterium]|nr:MAG: diguanylate cyclase [Chloroflexota bacterium]
MSTYIVRRLLQAVPLLILISMVVFGLIALAPGGVGEMYEGNPNISAADAARLEAQLGLDQPLYIRYWHWARRVAVGDWGTSLVTRRPVLAEIGARLPYTLQLMSTAFVVMLLIALPIGVHSALHPYSLFDHVATFWAFVGQAIPIFWFGLLLIMLFNVLLHNPTSPSTGFAWSHLWDCADCKPLLPGGGVAPYDVITPTVGQRLQHLILPVSMLALLGAGSYTRYLRGQMLEVIHLDYIRTARAKGLPERRIVWGHALRNAMTPLVTLLALDLPGLFGGALFTETIFSWPGMGRLFYQHAQRSDYPVLMGIVMVNAGLIILFNLLADILYAYLDPRVRYG